MEHKFHYFEKNLNQESAFRFSAEEQGEEQQYTYVNGLGFIPQTPQQEERRQLMFRYNILLFAVLLLYFLRRVSVMPVLKLLSILGADVTINPMTGLVSLSQTADQLLNILSYLVYMGIPAIAILFLMKKQVAVKKMFAYPNRGTTRYGVCILLGLSLVARAAQMLFSNLLQKGGMMIFHSKSDIPAEIVPLILYFISATLLPAVLEEFLFRGVVLNSLRRFGDVVAITVSTLLYTLIQPDLDSMVYVFIIGLGLGYFALKSGSVLVPMVANFFIRGIELFGDISRSILPSEKSALLLCGLYLVVLGLSILMFVRFLFKDERAFRIFNQDTYLTNRTKIKYLLTSFAFWMVMILAFLQVVGRIEFIN